MGNVVPGAVVGDTVLLVVVGAGPAVVELDRGRAFAVFASSPLHDARNAAIGPAPAPINDHRIRSRRLIDPPMWPSLAQRRSLFPRTIVPG
jgi:hypothetical protein